MKKKLNITLAQLNWNLGDVEGNCKKIIEETKKQQKKGSDIIIFSELSLTGFIPEDLISKKDFYYRCKNELKKIRKNSQKIAIAIGHPLIQNKKRYNALSIFWKKQKIGTYLKKKLTNYKIFDEKKYFCSGEKNCILLFKKYKLGFLIYENDNFSKSINSIKKKGAEIVIIISSSPFNYKKLNSQTKILQYQSKKNNLYIINLNQIGGKNELVFDGGSQTFDENGKINHYLKQFQEEIVQCKFKNNKLIPSKILRKKSPCITQIYQALVISTRDYINKNKFSNVVLGLSGGIDSSLTLTIAVDAIGKRKVLGIMMPFKYTKKTSIKNAQKQAKLLNIKFKIIPIESIYNSFISLLSPLFINKKKNITEENLQARCRAIILMTISNKNKSLVLTTTNKSELLVGYTTIYGDMSGGFAVLKDIPKTLVFKLAKYRNTISKVIPKNIINQPPSAELAPKQKDQDTLPKYTILDKILERYIEQNKSIHELIKDGFNEKTIKKIIKLIHANQYKIKQAPIGPIITI